MTAPPGGPYGQGPYGSNPYGQDPYWGGQPQGGPAPTRRRSLSTHRAVRATRRSAGTRTRRRRPTRTRPAVSPTRTAISARLAGRPYPPGPPPGGPRLEAAVADRRRSRRAGASSRWWRSCGDARRQRQQADHGRALAPTSTAGLAAEELRADRDRLHAERVRRRDAPDRHRSAPASSSFPASAAPRVDGVLRRPGPEPDRRGGRRRRTCPGPISG